MLHSFLSVDHIVPCQVIIKTCAFDQLHVFCVSRCQAIEVFPDVTVPFCYVHNQILQRGLWYLQTKNTLTSYTVKVVHMTSVQSHDIYSQISNYVKRRPEGRISIFSYNNNLLNTLCVIKNIDMLW